MLSETAENMGFVDRVLLLVRENEALIEVMLFLFAFGESVIFASIFVPSTIILVGIGALEGAAAGPLLPLILAAACGALCGDAFSFAIGHRCRDQLYNVWPLSRQRTQMERAQEFVKRWGILAIVISKLTGPFRPIVPMLAGASRMPLHKFAAASALSALAWSALFLAPAYYGVRLIAS